MSWGRLDRDALTTATGVVERVLRRADVTPPDRGSVASNGIMAAVETVVVNLFIVLPFDWIA